MKKYICIILLAFCVTTLGAYGAVSSTLPSQTTTSDIKPITSAPQNISPITPQPVDFTKCTKKFFINNQKLFYLTLSAVNANRFQIEEIQSQSGLVIFSVSGREYLACIVEVSSSISMLKITPIDNVYTFPIGIVQNMFKYIELNINTPIETLKIIP